MKSTRNDNHTVTLAYVQHRFHLKSVQLAFTE